MIFDLFIYFYFFLFKPSIDSLLLWMFIICNFVYPFVCLYREHPCKKFLHILLFQNILSILFILGKIISFFWRLSRPTLPPPLSGRVWTFIFGGVFIKFYQLFIKIVLMSGNISLFVCLDIILGEYIYVYQ